ncbi:NAD(P)H-hydrate dehydratase [Hydrogenophilus islandicus]
MNQVDVHLLLTIRALRSLEARYVPETPLMARAGAALADRLKRWGEQGATFLFLCGPGNNGGDGLVAATRLHEWGYPVAVVALPPSDAISPEHRDAWARWCQEGGTTVTDPLAVAQKGVPLVVVDALFGIGLTRPIGEPYASWLRWANEQQAYRVAVDIPSGLDADTGNRIGEVVFKADETVTFLADKPGLHTHDGPDHAGTVAVAPLGVTEALNEWANRSASALFSEEVEENASAESLPSDAGLLLERGLFSRWLVARPRNVHKGDFGHAAIIGGASGMVGALHLAARAALALGTGKVSAIAVTKDHLPCDPLHPEVMWPAGIPADATALAVGPGLGVTSPALFWLEQAVATPQPLVIDADALNLLARTPPLADQVALRNAPTVLTPHPGEAARLLAVSSAEVQRDRIGAAVAIARRFRATVLLKGCGSIIATPAGQWAINPTGHGGMASGGMGDTLTGLLVALLAQRWPPLAATAFAAYLHGAAAELAAQEGVGPVGLTASETAHFARRLLNRWLAGGVPTRPPTQPPCDTPSSP